MLRRVSAVAPLAVAARYQSAAPSEKRSKMQTLHKLLTGEIQFKNKALLKESNVELQFGSNWKKELEEYSAKLSAEEKKVLQRQVARLSLTRYTTRELASFAGEGAANVDANAKASNVAQGAAFLQAKGDAEFTRYVSEEAANANWSDAQLKEFVAAVKSAKK